MRIRSLVFAALLAALPTGSVLALDAKCPPGWEEATRDDDLIIFYKDNPSAGARELKAYTEVNAPPSIVFKVVTDLTHYPDFMPYVKESTILKRVSAHEVISYQLLSPPLVDDRDYILSIKSGEAGGGVYTSAWTSMPDYQAPRDGIVRVRLNQGSWRLEPIDGGKRTRIVYSLLTSPGGSIPHWIANKSNTVAIPNLFKAVKKRAASLM